MSVLDRFLTYVSFDTQSNPESTTTPSTKKQMKLAEYLKSEIEKMGLIDISLDQHAYLMATLPANTDKNIPTIGFISHLDTSPDMSGANVNPRIVKQYNGEDIILNEQEQIILSPKVFPELLQHINEDIIVTDGKTLLGADDKAGIAEIMTAMQYLIDHPEIKHGNIRIAFTPDEEIGRGALHFDVKQFGCEWAYTVDWGEVGELEYENFNAATAKVTIKGLNVHPGYAKDKMLNANLIAFQFNEILPSLERPEFTEGYQWFFHLASMKTTVEEATIEYIIRDFDTESFEKRINFLQESAKKINQQYTKEIVTVDIKKQFRNMYEVMQHQKHIVDLAEEAMKQVWVTPKIVPIRWGTDGAELSFKGLPCPNIFAGGMNFHGRYEWIPIQSMKKAVKVIVKIISLLYEREV